MARQLGRELSDLQVLDGKVQGYFTTNAIESLNSTYKRLNHQRSLFSSSKALLKTLYLATKRITQKWTKPLQNWSQVYNEFVIMYGDRMLVNED